MPTPPFILELREVWGHRPLLLIGLAAVVLDAHDQILCVRRADSGQWSLPAGILEPGEQPGAAMLRELREETAIEARLDRLVMVRVDPMTSYPNSDQVQFLSLVFRGTHLSGTARVADDESLEVGWFARDQLPEVPSKDHDRIAAALDDQDGPTRFS